MSLLFETIACIQHFYPLGLYEPDDKVYYAYPGMLERKKIIADNIYDQGVFEHRWVAFCDIVARITGRKVIGTTYGITSGYSAFIEAGRCGDSIDELHFFQSLLGPYYAVIGVNRQVRDDRDNRFQPIVSYTTSPTGAIQDVFLSVSEAIARKFESAFLPYSVYSVPVQGLIVDAYSRNRTIFHGLFNNLLEFNVLVQGDTDYVVEF